MATITDTFVIDKKAQRFFESIFPETWLIRKMDPDVHIDYQVEIVEDSEPTGLIFGIQLKGTGSPKYSGKCIKHSFKTKHLAYYLDKIKFPVFLMVVDVNKNAGYCLFTQEAATSNLKSNWRHIKNVDLSIPTSNTIGDIDAFVKEVKRADQFIRDLWPGSIAAAARHEEMKLTGLDDRFAVNIKYDNKTTCYELHPKEDVTGNILIKGPFAMKKMDELIKLGGPVEFDPGEFSITGSPIFDNMTEEFDIHGAKVEASRTMECEAVISIQNSKGKQLHSIHGIKVTMKAGLDVASVEAVLPGSPLSMKLKKGLSFSERPKKGDVTLSLDLAKWTGQSLLLLPYFDQIIKFVRLIEEGNKLKTSFSIHGNELFGGITHITKEAYFIKETLPHLEILENARFISRELKINPIVPDFRTITTDIAESIVKLRTIIEKGAYHQKNIGMRMSVVMTLGEEFVSMVKAGSYPENVIRIDQRGISAHLFGFPIENLPLSHILTNIKLTDESRRNLDSANLSDDVELEWEGQENSEYVIIKL